MNLSETARSIFQQALHACDVHRAFADKVQVLTHGNTHTLHLGHEQQVDLTEVARVVVIAMGKGAAPMLQSLLRLPVLVQGRDVRGLLVAPVCPAGLPAGVEYIEGCHPLPGEQSFAAARAALALLTQAAAAPEAARTLCLFLISGGASAMLELPLDRSISLADTVAFHRALVHSGASIAEINCVRKHFSAVKGGRLALAAGGMRTVTLLVSDVAANQLDALASGPTLPDRSTVADCRAILDRYDLLTQMPPAVQQFFSSHTMPETPKATDPNAVWFTLLSSEDLACQARAAAEALGFHAEIDNGCDDWEYKRATHYLLDRLRSLRRQHKRVCLLSAGEVTVRVSHPSPGLGGRNQHLALYAARQLGPQDGNTALLSAGSDGIDGNSPAAGAVVDIHTLAAVGPAEAEQALTGFNSYPLLHTLGATVVTGPTGNNLRDLRVLIAES